MAYIHPTSIVHPKAELGNKVTVGPFSIIMQDTQIGENTQIDSHVMVHNGTTIDSGNEIHSFVSLGEDPQDLKYQGIDTRLTIGKNNTIREFVTINRATGIDQERTVIGDNNFIMEYVHIAHDCIIGNGNIFSNYTGFAGHCQIADYTVFSARCTVQQFTRCGSYCFVGMGSIIRKDIAPYSKVSGVPATLFGINSIGLKRNNFNAEAIEAIRTAVKILLSQKNKDGRVNDPDIIELANKFSEIKILLDFVQQSDSGVVTSVFNAQRSTDEL